MLSLLVLWRISRSALFRGGLKTAASASLHLVDALDFRGGVGQWLVVSGLRGQALLQCRFIDGLRHFDRATAGAPHRADEFQQLYIDRLLGRLGRVFFFDGGPIMAGQIGGHGLVWRLPGGAEGAGVGGGAWGAPVAGLGPGGGGGGSTGSARQHGQRKGACGLFVPALRPNEGKVEGFFSLAHMVLGHYDVTTAVKSDHCSIRKARISRTDFGNHIRVLSAWMARNRFAMFSSSVTYRLPCTRRKPCSPSTAPISVYACVTPLG